MQFHPIEGNGNSNNVTSIDIEAAGVGEDGDEDMLLHVEGPGFKEKDQLVKGTLKAVMGSVAAMNLPNGSTTIWAETDEM